MDLSLPLHLIYVRTYVYSIFYWSIQKYVRSLTCIAKLHFSASLFSICNFGVEGASYRSLDQPMMDSHDAPNPILLKTSLPALHILHSAVILQIKSLLTLMSKHWDQTSFSSSPIETRFSLQHLADALWRSTVSGRTICFRVILPDIGTISYVSSQRTVYWTSRQEHKISESSQERTNNWGDKNHNNENLNKIDGATCGNSSDLHLLLHNAKYKAHNNTLQLNIWTIHKYRESINARAAVWCNVN